VYEITNQTLPKTGSACLTEVKMINIFGTCSFVAMFSRGTSLFLHDRTFFILMRAEI